MSIDELIKGRTIKEVLKSLNNVHKDLKTLTKPIKGLINPEEKRREDLFKLVKDLRIETENLIEEASKSREAKDLKVIKKISKRVKNIIEEKNKIKEELKFLNVKR
jgi:hypothetical protein